MGAVNLADAKARLSELVARAEAGEVISIMRRGRPVARIVPTESKREKVDLAWLRSVADQMPVETVSAGEFVQAMRDGERY